MAVDTGVSASVARQVEFTLDDEFLDRLRQLRSLVPLLTSLTERRDLVIDRVRARIPRALWRVGDGPEVVMEQSGLGLHLTVSSAVRHASQTQESGGRHHMPPSSASAKHMRHSRTAKRFASSPIFDSRPGERNSHAKKPHEVREAFFFSPAWDHPQTTQNSCRQGL